MNKSKSTMIITILVLLLCINITVAKCPTRNYKIKGVIVAYDNKPIQNAMVIIFFDKLDHGVAGFTLENGEFEIMCRYDTFNKLSLSGEHVCDKSPLTITVIMQKQNLVRKKEFLIKDIIYEDNILKLPSIELY